MLFLKKTEYSFFEVTNISILVVIGNSGTVYVIEKTKNLTRNDYLTIKKSIIKYRKAEVTFEEVITQLSPFGVIYNKF